MNTNSWLEVAAIVAPIVLAVWFDGRATRLRLTAVETRQIDDRARMDRHESDWHDAPARARRRA